MLTFILIFLMFGMYLSIQKAMGHKAGHANKLKKIQEKIKRAEARLDVAFHEKG